MRGCEERRRIRAGKRDLGYLGNERLPAWVQDACNVHGVPYFGDGRAVSNIDFEAHAEKAESDAHVTLTVRPSPQKPTDPSP